jgi:hypothetical protein
MTKLHELKIKYEQSQLAERAALETWAGLEDRYTASPSTVPYSLCEDVYEEFLVAESVRMTAQANYEDFKRARDKQSMKVILWAYALGVVAVIVWSMT